MDVGFQLLKGLALRETSWQFRNFRPESTFFSFVDDGFQYHGFKVAV